MEHRITIMVDELGRSEEAAEQVLDTLLEHHPEVGPVVSANVESGELSITWAIDAEDAWDAYGRSAPVFVCGMTASRAREVAPVRIEVEQVDVEEAVEDGASRVLELPPG